MIPYHILLEHIYAKRERRLTIQFIFAWIILFATALAIASFAGALLTTSNGLLIFFLILSLILFFLVGMPLLLYTTYRILFYSCRFYAKYDIDRITVKEARRYYLMKMDVTYPTDDYEDCIIERREDDFYVVKGLFFGDQMLKKISEWKITN